MLMFLRAEEKADTMYTIPVTATKIRGESHLIIPYTFAVIVSPF